MRISDWSSDVCYSDLHARRLEPGRGHGRSDIAATSQRDIRRIESAGLTGSSAHGRRKYWEIRHMAATVGETRASTGGDGSAREAEIGRASCRERVCRYG